MLARLLGPHAFGAYAVALVALFAMQNFNELGMSLAIVRWETDAREIVPTVTTVSVLVSAVTYVGCFSAAPAYASAMGAPGATTVVRVLAAAILIDGFCNTPNGLLQRNFRQGKIAIAVQVGGWLGTGVTVALAWAHYGVMSLAVGHVAGALVVAILLVTFAPGSLRFGFEPAKARALLRFGLPLAGANLITFAVTSVDQVVVGHMLGAVALGLYVLAFNLASWPLNMLGTPVRNVTPAVFSRLQHNRPAMQSTFLSAAGLLAAVTLPACLLIGGSAKPLIGFVYGTRWLPASQALMWLALLGGVRILFGLSYDYLVVLARTRFLLIVQLVWLLALTPALITATRADGIYGSGLAEAGVAVLIVLPCYLGGLKSAGVGLGALGKTLWLPAVAAAAAGLVAVGASRLARSDLIALTASGLATVAIVGLLAYRMRTTFAVLRRSAVEPTELDTSTAVTESGLGTAASTDGITEELRAIWGVIEASPTRYDDVANPAARDALLSSRLAQHDLTGPMLLQNEMLTSFSPRQDLVATSPLYLKTAALRWGAAKIPDRDQPPPRRSDGPGDVSGADGIMHGGDALESPATRGDEV